MKQLPKFNAILIAVCVLIIVIGFALMTGEPSGATEYNPDIFSFRRITLGPMISLAGFVLMIVAILFPRRKDNNNQSDNAQINTK
jgi:uncharacterized membrane protein